MLTYTGFKYCPKCSSTNISAKTENSMLCNTCGYVYFHNAASAVGGILTHKGKIILLRRGMEPMKGKLDAPGGFVNYNESAEDALKREIFEETALTVPSLKYFGAGSNIYKYRNVTYFTSDIFYTADIPSIENHRLSDEVTDMVLLKPEEINPDDLAFDSLRKMIGKFSKKINPTLTD